MADVRNQQAGKAILVVGPSLEGLGGVANYYRSIYPLLQQADLNIDYLPIGGTQAAFGPLSPVADQFRFLKALLRNRPQLVHINPSMNLKSFIRDMFFAMFTKLSGARCMVLFHGWEHEFAEKIENRYPWLFKMSFGKADLVLVLATEFREKLISWEVSAPIYVETTTVPDDLTLGFDQAAKQNRQRVAPALTILYLGRLEPEKGIIETLDAIELLLTRGLDIRLLVAGSGSIEDEMLAHIERSENLRANVEFVGYVRDEAKIAIMEQCDVFCFPTNYGEGLPTALLEAMAFGMALITCPIAGIKDIVADGENGYFVTQNEIEDIALKIEKLYRDRSLLTIISERNYQLARDRFMASKVSDRILGFYASINSG